MGEVEELRQDADVLVDAQGRRWVTQSNALIRACQGLSLAEKRLVACAISKLNSRRQLGPFEVPVTRVTAAEYAETFDVDANTAYEQLKDAAKNLYNRTIKFYKPAHRRRGAVLVTEVNMRWVGAAHYQEGEGWIELHWWQPLLKHLVGLSEQFTTYQLTQASAFRSLYSWRLLELLMRFKDTGRAEYTIEDFAASVEAPVTYRSDFAKIRAKIIEPAVKELVEKDGWTIAWRAVKAGYKVKAVHFTFTRDPQLRLFSTDKYVGDLIHERRELPKELS
jgi:plasmid replication initiation protein